MAITAVGTLVSGTGVTTLNVSPATIGNCLVLFIKLPSNTATVTSVSGGGCTWQRIAGPSIDTSGTPHTHYLYLGTVTAAGAATITAALSAGTADLDSQEFTNGSTGTTWSLDGSQAGFANNGTASTTITYPSLSPAGSGELYAGHARTPSGGSFSGLTGGFTGQTDANGNPYIYGVISATTAPSETSTSTASFCIGALITTAGGGGGGSPSGVISGVGTVVSSTSTTGVTRTISVSPAAPGNCLLLSVEVVSSSITVQSVTGGGCTTWTRLIQYQDTDSPSSSDELWLGTVTTAGSATITITGTSSLSGIQVDLDCQEFTASGYGSSSIWALDDSQAAGVTNASSTTLTWPTLTPTGPSAMYAGRGRVGSTTGTNTPASFTFQVDADGDPFIYGLVTGSTTPTQSVTSGVTVGTAALITVSIPSLITAARPGRTWERRFRRLQQIAPQGTGSTTATAGVATATGAALQPAVEVDAAAAAATGTGAAQQPIPVIGANSALATAAGTAQQPVPAVTPNAGLATAAGTAQPAAAAVTTPAGLATGTGTAQQPVPAITATAGLATGTGTALQPTVQTSGSTTATAGLATATGTALSPSATITASAGLATGIGTAQAPAPAVSAPAALAAATGTAQPPVPAVTASAGLATATGTAQQPSVSTSGNTTATAGLASATGTAQPPVPAVTALAGLATATGTAQAAQRIIPAGLATATSTAQAPAVTVLAQAQAATALAAALGATSNIIAPFTVATLTTATSGGTQATATSSTAAAATLTTTTSP